VCHTLPARTGIRSIPDFLVVGSQTTSLTPDPSFDHNLCYKCPNGSCEAILDIYTSGTFQRYKECLNARCFNPCNCALSFWESRRTPKSHFRECEWRPHICLKWGCDILVVLFSYYDKFLLHDLFDHGLNRLTIV